MATCPDGHPTTATDYCDVCGIAVGGAPPAAAPVAAPVAAQGPQRCAKCGAVRYGRFCEECGHDASIPVQEGDGPGAEPAAANGSWTAVVRADRGWFEEVRSRNGPDAADLGFPPFCPERRFALTGAQLTIGRRSRSRGIEPEIDLSGPPLDPGVSTLHALLVAGDSGTWSVVDLESTNGTTIGDGQSLLAANVPVELADGDRIKIGAWTTITITRA